MATRRKSVRFMRATAVSLNLHPHLHSDVACKQFADVLNVYMTNCMVITEHLIDAGGDDADVGAKFNLSLWAAMEVALLVAIAACFAEKAAHAVKPSVKLKSQSPYFV